MSATHPTSRRIFDPRDRWQGLTTADGLTVQGSALDGFHVSRNHVLLCSFYRGPEGEDLDAALNAYREIEESHEST